MRRTVVFSLLSLLFVSLNASAFLLSDTYVVEKQLSTSGGAGTVFELIPLGYSPETDSITHIKLTYDFTEIYSETNQGDEEPYVDGSMNEFVIFSSWIFGWRDVYADIDTGLTVFETDWTRSDQCQYEAFDPENEDNHWCALNLDLAGTLNAYVTSYTNNLLLHSIKVDVEVDRAEVPEPNPILLLGFGLFAIGFLRSLAVRKL